MYAQTDCKPELPSISSHTRTPHCDVSTTADRTDFPLRLLPIPSAVSVDTHTHTLAKRDANKIFQITRQGSAPESRDWARLLSDDGDFSKEKNKILFLVPGRSECWLRQTEKWLIIMSNIWYQCPLLKGRYSIGNSGNSPQELHVAILLVYFLFPEYKRLCTNTHSLYSHLPNFVLFAGATSLSSALTLTPSALLLNNKNPSKSSNCLCCLGS